MCTLKRQPKQHFSPNVNACATSSNQEEVAHVITLGRVGCIFYVVIAQKLAISLLPIWTFYQASAKSTVHHKHNNAKHTTTNMSRRRPTLQRICDLSPWQHQSWPQIMAQRLPVSPLQVPGGGFTLAAACSFVWGADKYPIKK